MGIERAGHFRLYDFQNKKFVGPLETRANAEKRKSRFTNGRRNITANWFRTRVHPVRVEYDGKTIASSWLPTIKEWRSRLAL